jgi:DNA replication protein DnaC
MILGDLTNWGTEQLMRHGLSKREAKADMQRVPLAIRQAIPKDTVKILLDGEVPPSGFGLGGNTDGGKTMALAAILRRHLEAWAKNTVPLKGKVEPYWFRWVCWPDEVQWLRSHAIADGTTDRLDALANVPLLILDDLGRERIKGSYAEDWAASQLDFVVNSRYREELVTLWTTNVREVDLAALYGGALMRRLTAENPLTWIENLGSAR